MLNLKHLYYFHTFGHLLNTAEAAKRLGISSPALSNQLKELDAFIGCKLTRRSDGKVQVTETGELVLNYTDQMFAIYEKLKVQLSISKDLKTTHFRIGVSPDLGAGFAFDLISLIEKSHLSKYQKVQVNFDSADKLIAEFKKDQYDLIIGAFNTALTNHSAWQSQTLSFPVNLFAPAFLKEKFVRKNGNLQTASLTKIIEFANEAHISLVLPMAPSSLRAETELYLQNSKASPTRTVVCNNSAAIVQMIQCGYALGFIPSLPIKWKIYR